MVRTALREVRKPSLDRGYAKRKPDLGRSDKVAFAFIHRSAQKGFSRKYRSGCTPLMRVCSLCYRFISDHSCSADSGGNIDKAVLVTSSECSRAASALSLPAPPT